jgi:hypothetical protein
LTFAFLFRVFTHHLFNSSSSSHSSDNDNVLCTLPNFANWLSSAGGPLLAQFCVSESGKRAFFF